MSVCRVLLITVAGTLLSLPGAVAQSTSSAKQAKTNPPPKSVLSLFGEDDELDHSPNHKRARMTVAEMRHARAMRASEQRRARIEFNRWRGHEPLRPSWNTIPVMRSRYERPVIYIPVYLYR